MDISNLARRYGPWIGVSIAALAYYPRFIKSPDGMMSYPQAAECLLNHQALPDCSLPFTYPPAFAFLMTPFVPLPVWARNLVWYLVTWAAIIVVWRGCEALARKLCPGDWTQRELAILRAVSALLSLKFFLAVLENQAYDLLSFAFIAAGLCAVADGRAKLGAAGLALAAAIKATPLVFLPWLIIKRRFAAAAMFALVLVVVSFLPDLFFAPGNAAHGHLTTWLNGIAATSLRDQASPYNFAFWAGPNLLNHSLRGAIARLIDERAQPELFKIVLYSTWLVFTAIVAALLLKSPQREAYTGIDGSILVIAMLMLSPMTSRSHYVLLLLPFMMLSALAVRDRVARPLTVAALAVSFVLTTVSSGDLVGERVTEWSYFYSMMPIGALVLMAALAAFIVSGTQADAKTSVSSFAQA